MKSAILIIDMQNGFCADDGSFARLGMNVKPFKALVPEVGLLRDAARERDMPIIFTRQSYREGYPEVGRRVREFYPGLMEQRGLLRGSWDAEIVSVLHPDSGEIVVDKDRYDAFISTDLDLLLRRLGISSMLIAGLSTNVCVESTVRSASQLDYQVCVASDATAATTAELHENALLAMSYAFASVEPWREFMRSCGDGSR